MAGAILREGRLERYICAGVQSARTGGVVDEGTVFDAASLSKPVFAYAILQLVEQGTLSLHTALNDFFPAISQQTRAHRR
jgi:CubicO group peptidase (beta-lactamase class C family)